MVINPLIGIYIAITSIPIMGWMTINLIPCFDPGTYEDPNPNFKDVKNYVRTLPNEHPSCPSDLPREHHAAEELNGNIAGVEGTLWQFLPREKQQQLHSVF